MAPIDAAASIIAHVTFETGGVVRSQAQRCATGTSPSTASMCWPQPFGGSKSLVRRIKHIKKLRAASVGLKQLCAQNRQHHPRYFGPVVVYNFKSIKDLAAHAGPTTCYNGKLGMVTQKYMY